MRSRSETIAEILPWANSTRTRSAETSLRPAGSARHGLALHTISPQRGASRCSQPVPACRSGPPGARCIAGCDCLRRREDIGRRRKRTLGEKMIGHPRQAPVLHGDQKQERCYRQRDGERGTPHRRICAICGAAAARSTGGRDEPPRRSRPPTLLRLRPIPPGPRSPS